MIYGTDPSPAAAGEELDRVTDLLAVAVKTQWERAAGERGLMAEPIPVTWGKPSLPLAGPVAAAAKSRRFALLPGMTPSEEVQLAAGQIDDLYAVSYQSGDDARELLDRCDTIQKRVSGAKAAEEITDHLLDRVLPAAYAPRPGQPRHGTTCKPLRTPSRRSLTA